MFITTDSHLIYVDDVLIFTKANPKSLAFSGDQALPGYAYCICERLVVYATQYATFSVEVIFQRKVPGACAYAQVRPYRRCDPDPGLF